MPDIMQSAQGHWPSILSTLAGLTAEQLTDTHQPCPLCGGEDRYRFDDLDGSGSWYCNQCGGKSQSGGGGNGMELLMRKTGWDFATAAQRIEAHLGIPSSTTRRRAKPHRIPEKPPADAPPPNLGRATAQWCYRNAEGEQLFWIQRLQIPAKPDKPARKVFVHRVWLDGGWHYPRSRGDNADTFTCEWPTPRPLYNLHQLTERPDAKVLVVEGEKAADAAAELFPFLVVISWPNGAKAINLIDWSPLAGRAVTLWPDNDEPGRQAMLTIAAKLHTLGCSLKIIPGDPDQPDGWDIADADFTPEQALAYVSTHIKPVQTSALLQELTQPATPAADPDPIRDPEPDPVKPSKNGYFTCLGFDADGYYYQPHSTGQVVRLSRSSHTGTNLVAIAPLEYWESSYYGKSGPNWTAAASDLFANQSAVGVYSPDRIRGRGAWLDATRTVLHFGDRLIVNGTTHPITSTFDSAFLYQRAIAITGPGDSKPLTAEEAMQLTYLSERFHWEVPVSGTLLAGWVALAPICGALRWRPHIWLTAAAGSGKSAILDRYVAPLLADTAVHVAGNTSEAGLRQTLRADALPVVFDEAESNERQDQQRMQSILALARVASSESHAHLLKGSPSGDVTRFTIRSMFMMSSIATALKQGADRSRFAQLTLRIPSELTQEQRQAHWEELDRDLDRHITTEFGRRLQARTMGMIGTIRQSVVTFSKAAAERFDSQRLGDQYGTLLAGAWSLMSDDPATIDDARQLIEQNNWEPYSQATEVPDERRCIQRILQHQVRVEADDRPCTRTLGELAEIAAHHRMDREVEPRTAMDTLSRHGLKVDQDSATLIVSNTAEAIAAILRDSAWSHSWATVLSRLPGATKTGAVRFGGAGTVSRAVALQIKGL